MDSSLRPNREPDIREASAAGGELSISSKASERGAVPGVVGGRSGYPQRTDYWVEWRVEWRERQFL